LYRSWPFLTTRLVTDKTTIPLAESAISHLVVLEVGMLFFEITIRYFAYCLYLPLQ
jgi:hypothetical protein